MADEGTAPEIQINIKGPSELKLQISITTDKTVRELKQAIAEKSNVEAGRQRLIYSGRVLKDEDALATYKIQSSHTIHMVKSMASSTESSARSAAPQPLPTMQTGQNPHDPLTQLNSHLGFGAMAGLNPFADMGLNPNDPNMMQNMMNSPQFMQQMASMMSNPAILDQIISMNPQLQGAAPQLRQMFQSEQFREIVSNPERLRAMMDMASLFNGGGLGGGGGPFGQATPFPAPGTPGGATSTPTSTSTTSNTASSTTTPSTGGTANPPNPFNLFGQPGSGAPNPLFNPALMQQMFGGGPLGGFPSAPSQPADTRPPEERFQVQLQQLQDMGFTNASQNIRALLATGGNVHSAIEYILGGGGL